MRPEPAAREGAVTTLGGTRGTADVRPRARLAAARRLYDLARPRDAGRPARRPAYPRCVSRSPQEKKRLSYEKDRRNSYGENDQASRKAIPLRKRLVNRANRHDAARVLGTATGRPDAEAAEAAEQTARGRRPKRWSKQPDQPLGAYLADRSARR